MTGIPAGIYKVYVSQVRYVNLSWTDHGIMK